jgi:putative PIN family toxin of toxin-antitoxin system
MHDSPLVTSYLFSPPNFVIDSNIWIDAVISDDRNFKNICNQAIDYARNEGVIVGNRRTLQDLANATHKKLSKNEMTQSSADKMFEKYKKLVKRVHEKNNLADYAAKYKEGLSKCEDKDDWAFLALAHEQNASRIITNDKHLLDMHDYMGAKIVTPGTFLQEMAAQRITGNHNNMGGGGNETFNSGNSGGSLKNMSDYAKMSNEQLYGKISLFMPPEEFKKFLGVLEERMKDPDSADELMSLALEDKARIKHFNELLHINKDKLSVEERQFGESFIRVFNAHEEEERKKPEVTQADEREEEKPIERYSLLEERREEKERQEKAAGRKSRSDGQENGEARARDIDDETEGEEEIVKEPEEADIRQQSSSMLSSADMANARTASFEFLNDQAMTDNGLNASDGKIQSAANASDELKGMSANVSYKDAVINVRKKLGNNDVRPPKLNEEYGPGKLSVDKQLALLTLSNNKVIAYQAKDFQGKFEEGKIYDISSIKRTEQGIYVKSGIERDLAKEQEKRLEQERQREKEKARQSVREATRAIGGIIKDGGRDIGRDMEM